MIDAYVPDDDTEDVDDNVDEEYEEVRCRGMVEYCVNISEGEFELVTIDHPSSEAEWTLDTSAQSWADLDTPSTSPS